MKDDFYNFLTFHSTIKATLGNTSLIHNKWLVKAQGSTDPDYRVFCFPYAGGSAAVFKNWQKKLGEKVEVISIQLPGRATRLDEPVISSMNPIIEELINAVSHYIDRPYIFFGHSLGSRIAFELVLKFFEQHVRLPDHFIVSASRGPNLPIGIGNIHELSDDEFTTEIGKLNGTPNIILENKELMKILLPSLKGDFRLAYEYIYKGEIRLKIPISIFTGRQDTAITKKDLKEWNRFFKGQSEITFFEGGHFFLNEEQDSVLKKVQSILKELNGIMPGKDHEH